MTKIFTDYNEFEQYLLDILYGRSDLASMQRSIIHALKSTSKHWAWDCIPFEGIVLPKIEEENYKFQLVVKGKTTFNLTFFVNENSVVHHMEKDIRVLEE